MKTLHFFQLFCSFYGILLFLFASTFSLKAQEVPLYGLWWDGSTEYLVQIDPYTATHEIVGEMTGIQAVALGSSTMIHGTQLYAFKGHGAGGGGLDLVLASTNSGNIVNQVPAASYPYDYFTELEYDLKFSQMWGLETNFVTDTIVTIDSLLTFDDITTLDTIITIDTLITVDTLIGMDSLVTMDTIITIDSLIEVDYITTTDTIIVVDTIFELINAYNSLANVDLNDGTVGNSFPIPGTQAIAVNSSTFNSNDGHYIYIGVDENNDKRLYTIDTEDEIILHNPITTNMGNAELHYDNVLNKLFGLVRSSENSYDPITGMVTDTLQLVEIDPITATKTVVAEYPEVHGVVLGGTTYIDDSSQYVFSGIDPTGIKRMYVTDVNSGTLVANEVFTNNYIELQVNNYAFGQKLYAPTGLELELKIYLEGAYDEGGQMNNFGNAFIPTNQPYGVAPYLYNGNESLTEIPIDMVDWVLVEIRTGTPNEAGSKGTETVDTKAAILTKDGHIIGTDGSPLRFDNLPDASEFYVCIRHRNHLDVLTANAIATTGTVIYDFTTDVNQAFGSQQLKLSIDGQAMLFAGDYTQDGIIQVTDYDIWHTTPAVLNAYQSMDGNLDGVIQVTDYDAWFVNKAKVGVVEIEF